MKKDEKYLIIPKIAEGIVIDHIPAGLGAEIVSFIKYFPELKETPVTLGLNFSSKRLGKKDLVKIQTEKLPEKFLHYLAVTAPGVTIKQISNYQVQRKIVAEPPEILSGLMKCPNPACISNFERVIKTSFHCVTHEPLKYVCVYCERLFGIDELELLLKSPSLFDG